MKNKFITRTHAKCTIVGEHAVFKGSPALAKSINYYFFELKYEVTKHAIIADTEYENILSNETLLLYFWDLLRKAYEYIGRDFSTLEGKFLISSNIPVCAGLGFSAAICVAVTKWLIWQGFVEKDKLFYFSKRLEDLFHGKSSGVDIAAVMHEKLILYKLGDEITEINPYWEPKLYVYPTSYLCLTCDALEKISKMNQENSKVITKITNDMQDAVMKALVALETNNNAKLGLLAEAIDNAEYCFQRWGLIPREINDEIKMLKSAGAIAVKPAGAGNGGSLLSLWNKEPPIELRKRLVSIF